MIDDKFLVNEERAIFALRALYQGYGYVPFKMSKFEEYDLYVRNKDFLVSDRVITFNDTNGKLLALKPDVTLSIIKNATENSKTKVYYNENVYRISGSTGQFKEIMQAGLECIGDVDISDVYEALYLAAKSLESVRADYVLDISHMGLLTSVLEYAGVAEEKRQSHINAISRRSADTVRSIITNEKTADTVCRLISEYSTVSDFLPVLEELLPKNNATEELRGICEILSSFGIDRKIYLDFSLVNDMSYYNGIIFKGFVSGIPTEVLSGGRYDPLLSRFGMSCGGCGFAIYLDRISASGSKNHAKDADVLLVYDDSVSGSDVALKIKQLTGEGKTVKAVHSSMTFKEDRFGESIKMFD